MPNGNRGTKKILCDAEVASLATKGIKMEIDGKLKKEQREAWIALDEDYIERCKALMD
jgi:hypothetical protein